MKNILLVFFLFFGFWANSQDRSVLNLANDNDYATFSIFDSIGIEDYNLFFTGEDHRYPLSNSDIELKMFKYLHKRVGVRTYLLEFGEGMAYFINKYISQGDSNAKIVLKNNLSKTYFRLFTGLKNFNDSLPATEKITAIGIDIDREPTYAVSYLEQFLPNNFENVDDSIKIHLEALKAISEYYKTKSDGWNAKEEIFDGKEYLSIDKTITLFIKNFEANKEKYNSLLGDNYTDFSKAIVWLNEYFYWKSLSSSAQQYLFRENFMANNLKKLFSSQPNIKAYGQFGRCHTQTNRNEKDCSYYYFNSLATRLNNGSHARLKGKVFSCPIFYPNSYDFSASTTVDKGLKKMTKNTEKNKIMVFALDSTSYPNQNTLAQRYTAVIINNLEKDKSVDGTSGEENPFVSDFDFHSSSERLLLLAEAGFKNYNFNNVNNALGTNFNNQLQYLGFSLGYVENKDFAMSTAFLWFPSNESKVNDSTSASLKGFAVSMRYGKDLLKNKNFDLILGAGYGFERFTNTIVEKFDDKARRDILGNNRTTQFTNPTFFIDGGLDFRVHINWVTFGVYGRYQFDFSNKKWRQNGDIVSNSPRLSLSAYSVGASLGFNLGL